MNFNAVLETLPTIDHLTGLNILNGKTVIHRILATPGKFGSLRVYYALAQKFDGKLDRTSAEKGLELFAEHTADAKAHPGKHPNIDLLIQIMMENMTYLLQPIES